MGHSRYDILIKEKKYYLNSMSNEEDIFKVLWTLDKMVYDSLNDNKEALVQLIDLYDVLPENNKAIHEYVAIQNGTSPLQVNSEIRGIDVNNEIPSIIAERLGITKQECELQLLEGVKDMINYNFKKWRKVIGKRNKMSYGYREAFGKVLYQNSDKEISTDITRKNTIQDIVCEEAVKYISDLEKSILGNQKKLKELREKEGRNPLEKEELNKRIKYDKQLYEDLNIIKSCYGIGGRSAGIMQSKKMHEKSIYLDDFLMDDNKQSEEAAYEDLTYDWQTEKIKQMAYIELTERQYLIFYLYYFCGLTYQTIGTLLKDSKGNICTQIQKIIKKIQNKIEEQNFLGNVAY